MRVLGIDTSTATASVGVRVGDSVVAEESQTASRSHTVSLLDLIDVVLRRAGLTVGDLDAIAVSNGPGTFTGLRISLSVAKGLAYASGAQVVGIPTLEALARTVAGEDIPICALLDARKGEVYAACFQPGPRGLRRLTADMLLTPEALLEHLPAPCVVLGDGLWRYQDFLRQRVRTPLRLLPPEAYGPRGGVVATLGSERLRAGSSGDLARLEPAYIRPPDARLRAR